MSLKNLSGQSISGVTLRRQVDFDVDAGGSAGTNNFDNRWGASSASVFAYNDTGGGPTLSPPHGMMLRILAVKGFQILFPGATPTINDTDCSPVIDATPVAPTDEGASYTIVGKPMPAGVTWTETIEYDAF
jgi:hypothetical protein